LAHEFTGIVEEVGLLVQKLKIGDQVLVLLISLAANVIFVSRAYMVIAMNQNPIATTVGGNFRYSHTAGGFDGGQAEYVGVPYADFGPTVPAEMDPNDAVLLRDVVPTGYQAAEMGGIKEDDTVVIFGAGPIGIMAARCAWLFGPARVIIIDHIEYRLQFARNYAQCEAYNFKDMEDPVVFLKKATDWHAADVCIDCVGCKAEGNILQTFSGRVASLQSGAATALQWAINSVKKGGIVSVVGVYGPPFYLVPFGNIVNQGITIMANQVSVKGCCLS
jgi:threonine dehydrogenase-like Zn-dependent dehydrogenase